MERDGRTEVRLRHRRAILDAAIELIEEGDGSRFSADELADRAGVSRRTVFNHFASLDDVLLAVCAETLDVVAAQLRPPVAAQLSAAGGRGPGPAGDPRPVGDPRAVEDPRTAAFAAMARALRGADVSDRIIQLWRALGGAAVDAQRAQAFAQHALALVADGLAVQLTASHPQLEPLEVDLLASLLTHGLGVIAAHWVATADSGTPPVRAEWDRLLDRLLDTVGSGYLPRSRDVEPRDVEPQEPRDVEPRDPETPRPRTPESPQPSPLPGTARK